MIIKAINLKKYKVIEPFKYHVQVGESIIKIIENSKTYFTHLDHKKRIIFRTQGTPHLQNNNMISSVTDFEKLFREMVKKEKHFNPTEEDITSLLNISKKPPVIIGGCGRSGTTLLTAILDVLPNLHVIKEETYAFYPNPIRPRKILNYLKDTGYNGKMQWCEKTPKNIMNFRKIFKIFNGNVKLIHLIRDGRDVVTSVHPNSNGHYWIPSYRWINDVKTGLDFSNKVYLLKYENLVTDPKKQLQSLCSYIGQPFTDKLLDFSQFTTMQNDIAWFNGVQTINTSRIGKWKNPEHKNKITEFLSFKEARNLLKRLNYE